MTGVISFMFPKRVLDKTKNVEREVLYYKT